jgi:diguanylate cyclase (GGDEF)-like protein/PAS domain S-box-containing protein
MRRRKFRPQSPPSSKTFRRYSAALPGGESREGVHDVLRNISPRKKAFLVLAVVIIGTAVLGVTVFWQLVSLRTSLDAPGALAHANMLIALLVALTIVSPLLLSVCWLVLQRLHDGFGAPLEKVLAAQPLDLAHAVFQNVQEGIVITDLDGRIIGVNPAFSAITEYSEAELLQQHIRMLKSGRHDRAFYDAMWRSIRKTGSWKGEMWDRRKNGEVYPQWLSITALKDSRGEVTRYIGVVTDISRMQHAESHLQYLAHHDALTGLPNRALLNLRLRHSLERAAREGGRCAVVFLDLDGFKKVNDDLGHEAGDELLQRAADRMRRRLRENDTLARLGGDEFVMVLEQVHFKEDAQGVARSLVTELAGPFRLADGRVARVGASVGLSLFPDDASDARSLLKCADTALYEAKQAGRGTWRCHEPGLSSSLPQDAGSAQA